MANQLSKSNKIARNERIRRLAEMHMSYREIQATIQRDMGVKISFSTIRMALNPEMHKDLDGKFSEAFQYLNSPEYQVLAKKAKQLKLTQLTFDSWCKKNGKN